MMVVGKEDLGLSLSLACSTTTPSTISNNINNNNNHNNQKNHHHHMGLMMFMNRNNNNHNNNSVVNQNTPHHQTNTSSNNNNNNNKNNNNITRSPPLQLNLMMANPASASGSGSLLHKLYRNSSTDSFPASDRNSDSSKLFLRGIDVNKSAGDEEEAGVSSPNSTVSTVSGKRSLGERDSASAGIGDDIDAERTSSRGMSDDEEGGENSRKKLRLTKDQSATLEESFKEHNTLNPKQKLALAKRLGLRPRQVEVWFQNRRARTKLKQTEVDCEFLKRCCEQLTEENRRLQKEVQELRQLKLSPQFYMQMTPPTTLTMCPSCERVAVPQSAPVSTTASASAHPNPRPGHGPDSRVNQRHMAVNPWVGSPVPIRSFDGLNARS